ncbi:MAG: transcriptional repressor NrdR [Candidatus Omnitrophica bacterium]|nr:transcriptional repressor NrdR [Candidatus Omnitrophota bacterium]
MRCPSCSHKDTNVMDSRVNSDGTSIRRRRKCPKCEERFTTYEYVEAVPLMVVKRDGRRQAFDRTRVLNGLIKACEKRPIGVEQIETMVDDIEHTIRKKYDREIFSKDIGEMVMARLSDLDEVAYVRFASVYRQFRDVNQFMNELQMILSKNKIKKLKKQKARVSK